MIYFTIKYRLSIQNDIFFFYFSFRPLFFFFRFDSKAKKLVARFAMTGKLSVLAELHRALYILLLDSKIVSDLTLEEVMAMEFDGKGKLDISVLQTPQYSDKICR